MHKTILAPASGVIRNWLVTASMATGLLTPLLSIASEPVKPTAEITFLTWGDYINMDVVTEFEAKYQAKVNLVYYESDDARNELLTTYGIDGYDLILLDSVNIPLYKQLNWIIPFNGSSTPNLNNVKLPVLSNLDEKVQTCAPYFWGSTGIAYRKDLVPEPITSWKQIFNPVPELKGKIIMSTMSQETVGMALKSLGYSMGSSDGKELEEARQLLLAQAASVTDYSAVSIVPEKSKLVTGEVSAILTYNSDAMRLKKFNPEIEYALPKEGGAIWVDFVCLSAKANNPELSHRFIDFLNQPQQAANNALFINAATPNKEAERLLPAELLNNPIIYPDKDAIAHSEKYKILPTRTMKKQNAIMNELTMKKLDN